MPCRPVCIASDQCKKHCSRAVASSNRMTGTMTTTSTTTSAHRTSRGGQLLLPSVPVRSSSWSLLPAIGHSGNTFTFTNSSSKFPGKLRATVADPAPLLSTNLKKRARSVPPPLAIFEHPLSPPTSPHPRDEPTKSQTSTAFARCPFAPQHSTTTSSSPGVGVARCPFAQQNLLTEEALKASGDFVPLVMHPGGPGHNGMGHNNRTKALLAEIGGQDAIINMTNIFYKKFWNDQYLKQFLGELHTPLETHAKRIGMYMCEMMGQSGPLWSHDMETRPVEEAPVLGGKTVTITTRQLAHYVALNSVTRTPEAIGDGKFKLQDCRVWMRLMFWACREAGLDQFPKFFAYFQRWIGHFTPVYEKTSGKFTRAEARWSANPENLKLYAANGNRMLDIVGVSVDDQLATLPHEEREEEGAAGPGGADSWLYDDCVTITTNINQSSSSSTFMPTPPHH